VQIPVPTSRAPVPPKQNSTMPKSSRQLSFKSGIKKKADPVTTEVGAISETVSTATAANTVESSQALIESLQKIEAPPAPFLSKSPVSFESNRFSKSTKFTPSLSGLGGIRE
jgi:hypothetical protein